MQKLLFIILILGMKLCYAQEFTYATTSKRGIDFYYKIESENMFEKTIWLKSEVPLKRVKLKSGKYTTSGGGYDLSYMTINCRTMKYSKDKLYIYDRNGNLKHQYDEYDFNEPIVPGTVLDGVRRAVCTEN